MKQYNIGLDFGTYQTKVCVFDMENEVHEFFRFSSDSFFLPTRIGHRDDGRFEYGDTNSGRSVKEYFYFKMAAAEDTEFRLESSTDSNSINTAMYDAKEFTPFSPEFLVTIYVTYIILIVKEEYQKRNTYKSKSGSFLSKFLNTSNPISEEFKITIKMGIPTEWSQKKNLRRKRKFENILLTANFLQNQYKTPDNFIDQKSETLMQDIKGYFAENNFSSLDLFNTKLNNEGLSVYPETAAGLTFITSTYQLATGYYAIMDIGGGTTDISFFRLTDKGEIKYLASESYMMAANNVYRQLLCDGDSVLKMHQIEQEIKISSDDGTWKDSDKLKDAVRKVRKELGVLLEKLFMRRVYRYDDGRMLKKYRGQPIIVYGGGLGISEIIHTPTSVYNFGVKVFTPGTRPVEMDVIPIDKYSAKVNLLPEKENWVNDFYMLVVALGLSFIKSESSAEWFDTTEYNPIDVNIPAGESMRSTQEAHPFNEDCFIYNVLLSKWQ